MATRTHPLETREFTACALLMLVVVGVITLVGNRIGYDGGIVAAAPGMALIIVIGLASLLLARFAPIELPAFAYAMIIAFCLSLPYSPVQETVVGLTKPINFLATTTPILAYAGLSVALQVQRMREVSWKLILVACLVFLGTFFGSAIVAQIVLSAQGII